MLYWLLNLYFSSPSLTASVDSRLGSKTPLWRQEFLLLHKIVTLDMPPGVSFSSEFLELCGWMPSSRQVCLYVNTSWWSILEITHWHHSILRELCSMVIMLHVEEPVCTQPWKHRGTHLSSLYDNFGGIRSLCNSPSSLHSYPFLSLEWRPVVILQISTQLPLSVHNW